jgi:glycosyltransferase involved in cell wall biosynthesis
VRAYAQVGDTMEIVCQDDPNSPFLKDVPCVVHALGQRWIGRYGLSPRLWQWLGKNISRFDGIVMQGIWTFPGLAVRLAALREGKPYCVFAHGALDPWFNKRYPFKHVKKFIYWRFQYPVLRDATAVLFTSALEPDLARTSFSPNAWNSVVFPNGVHEPSGDPAAQIEAFYTRFPTLRSRRFLLFLSRLHSKKGCDFLIPAFAKVATQFPELDLIMAGPDQTGWQARLQRMAAQCGIADRVHWPGMLSGDLKWGALRASDAFVLPSHSENFGIAVVESLAAGRPVLITNKVNIWPEIEMDGAGLIGDDTLEGTEELLQRWLNFPQLERDAMAARAYPCFARRYSLKNGAMTITRIFREANFAARQSEDAGGHLATG